MITFTKEDTMEKQEKKYNIYDIAKELNLAPSTISKAINNAPTISEATKKRVLDYIKLKGYSPNIAASSLKSKISMSIGVAYPAEFKNFMSHYFFSRVIESFREYIEKNGYEFSYVTNYLGNYKVSYLDYAIRRNLDGILILASTKEDEEIMELVNSNIPVVSIDQISEKTVFVQTNDSMASQLIIDHIKKQNFQKIVYMSGPFDRGEFAKRTEQFIKQARINGLEIKDSDIYVTNDTTVEDAIISTMKNEALYQEKPDVIVASSDEIAMGVILGLNKKGFKVPEDIAVIGFDDFAFAKYFNPPLTTIRQDYKEIGSLAGKRLIQLINHKENVKLENYVDCELIIRESTRRKL